MEDIIKSREFVICGADKRMKNLSAIIKDKGGTVVGENETKGEGAVYVLPPFSYLKPETAGGLPAGCIVFCRGLFGGADKIAADKGIKVLDYNSDEVLTQKNAVLTAEGALGYIINCTEKGLGDIKILVLGLGRVGGAIVRLLRPINVFCAAASFDKKETALAAAYASAAYDLKKIKNYIGRFDAVINTVPKEVIGEDALKKLKKDALIIDLASAPGGVDYAAAKTLGVNAVHYQGVPSITAPLTAAEYLYDSLIRRLKG